MAEKKPGLLKRIFSFGGKKPEQTPPPEPALIAAQPLLEPEPVPEPGSAALELIAKPEPPAAPITERQNAKRPKAPPRPDERSAGPPAERLTEQAVEKPTPDAPAAPTKVAKTADLAPTDEKANIEPGGEEVPGEVAAAAEKSWYQRLSRGLTRSSTKLTGSITSLFTDRRLDDELLEQLEDVLIEADLGVDTAGQITEALSARRYGRQVTGEEVRQIMAQEIAKVLEPAARPLELDLAHNPHVILVVGVNGSGKTTTIGKLAAKLSHAGHSTLLVAGDTFRAAAVEQLHIWGQRIGSPVLSGKRGADAAGLAFDAITKARDAGHDVIIMDTAGRLQNKAELMAELEKIIRVMKKHDPSAPHTVLLTLDATTGQNGFNQVEIFGNTAGVNGLVMTKLDGTAKGGVLVGLAAKYQLPVHFIGVGEQVEDLQPFDANEFARSLVGLQED